MIREYSLVAGRGHDKGGSLAGLEEIPNPSGLSRLREKGIMRVESDVDVATTKKELLSIGWSSKGIVSCPKCKRQAERLESSSGEFVLLQVGDENPDCGLLHSNHCD